MEESVDHTQIDFGSQFEFATASQFDFGDKGYADDIERNGYGWDDKTEQTFITWTQKASVIRDNILVKLKANKAKYRRLNMISFVASGASTLLATIGALTTGSEAMVLSSISAGTAFVTFVTTSIIHSNSLDTTIESLSSYLSVVSGLIAILETELDMPVDSRKNAEELIKTVSPVYTEILSRKDTN